MRTFGLVGADGSARRLEFGGREDWLLSDVFQRLLLPELEDQGRTAATIAEYRRYLDRWDDWCKCGCTSLALGDIDRQSLLDYRTYVRRIHKCGNGALNKHVGAIQTVLRMAVEHKLLGAVPTLPPLAHRRAARKLYLSYDELGRLYDACDLATWPRENCRGEPLARGPAVQWRAAIVLWFNYGFRTQELVSRLRRMDTLRWRKIFRQELSPADDGRARCEYGWLAYTPQKQRWAKDTPLVLPINRIVDAHLRSIEPPAADPDARVFDWKMSSDNFYEQWSLLCRAAGIRPRPDPRTGECGQYEVKHLRKTSVTWHNFHCPGIAGYIVGHQDRETSGLNVTSKITSQHYDNQELAVLDAVLNLPQPQSFHRVFHGERQRTLFDLL